MGYSDGQLNSRRSHPESSGKGEQGLPGVVFNLTADGDFHLLNKRLTDVADPVDNQDAGTKKYVYEKVSGLDSSSLQAEVAKKADFNTLNTQTFNSKIIIPDYNDKDRLNSKVVNLKIC